MPDPADKNIEKYPFAYARHKIILDESGKPVNYRFLDVNAAFEDMTGLKKENILNKTVTEVLPGILEDDFDWVALFGHVALTGEDKSLVQYSLALEQWYQVYVYSSENGYFVTLFSVMLQNEAKFYEFAERSSDLIYRYEFTPKPGYTYVNKASTKIFGFTPEEHYLDPQLTMKIIHSDDKQRFLDYIGGEIPIDKPIQLRWVHKNGQVVWVEQRNTPVYDTKGNLIALEGIGRDITDMKKAQEQVIESEGKYRQLIENINSVVLKWSRNGQIEFLNEYGKELFGYTEEEILGKPVVGTIVPEIEESGRDLASLMDDIFIQPEKYTSNINENRTKNGRRIWISWTNSPTYNEKGKVVGMLSVGKDVTERILAQEELRKSEKRYKDLVENINEIIYVLDKDATITYISPNVESVSDYKPEEVIGKNFVEFVHPDDIEERMEQFRKVFSGTD